MWNRKRDKIKRSLAIPGASSGSINILDIDILIFLIKALNEKYDKKILKDYLGCVTVIRPYSRAHILSTDEVHFKERCRVHDIILNSHMRGYNFF